MKIVFLCGSLESGKDGVGDYTRLLSSELVKESFQVQIIAINDPYISEIVHEYIELGDGAKIRVCRLPITIRSKQRSKIIAELTKNFNPDFINLQYVPYSFSKKGLPYKLNNELSSLAKKYEWLITFHELWLDSPNNFKQKLVAIAQKYIIGKLVHKLNPKSVFVTNQFNGSRLSSIGIRSSILPLFGNINHTASESELKLKDLEFSPIRILYFGSAPKDLFLTIILKGIAKFLENFKKPIVIVLVSGNSSAKDAFVQLLTEKFSKYQICISDYGFVSEDILSELMIKCSVGIARSEPHLLGKSGSAAAMLEHGLPLWLPKWNNGVKMEYDFRREIIFNDLTDALNLTDRPDYKSLLPEISRQFINNLQFKK